MGNLQSVEHEQGHLGKGEVERLERRVRKLGRGRGELARSDLLAVEGLAGNPFTERIFQMYDTDGDRLLMLGDIRAMMERLLTLRDEEARSQFAFAVFDTNGDGVIDREELLQVLKLTNKRSMSPEQLEQVADSTIARFDEEGRGSLAYPAFKSLLRSATADLSL